MQVLRRFGFGEQWIDMVWRLISNVWFSVLVNGGPQGYFKSTRGLRQGDPISPALFVIGAEVLSRMLNSLAVRPGFVPFRVPAGCPIITHLAYANDVIIFCRARKQSIQMVMQILMEYCAVSGQQVNQSKSCYMSHSKLPLERRRVGGQMTGFQWKAFPVKYLGFPLFYGRCRCSYFSKVCSKVTARIQSWKGRLLSIGGRLVLLKSVLAALPTYLLAASSPPRKVLTALERLFADFLWGESEFGKRFH